jgi:ribosomal protein S17E
MPSKKIRNKIAGYLARLVRQKAEAKKNFKPRQFVSEESKEEVQ